MAPGIGSSPTFGLDQLLDQASAITLNDSPPPSVQSKRHPLPSRDIADWQPALLSHDEELPPPKLPSVANRRLLLLPSGENGPGWQINRNGKGSQASKKNDPAKVSHIFRIGSPVNDRAFAAKKGVFERFSHGIDQEVLHLDNDEGSISSKFSEDLPNDPMMRKFADLSLPLLDATSFASLRKPESAVSLSSRAIVYNNGLDGSPSTSSNSSGNISTNESAPLSLRKLRPEDKLVPEQCNDGPTFSQPRRMSYPITPAFAADNSPEKEAPDLQRSISLDGGFTRNFTDAQTEEHYSRPRKSTEKSFDFSTGQNLRTDVEEVSEMILKRQTKSASDLQKQKMAPPTKPPPSVRRSRSDASFRRGVDSPTDLVQQPKFHSFESTMRLPAVTEGVCFDNGSNAGDLGRNGKAKSWMTEREQSLMRTTVKALGEYLEDEAQRALAKMPLAVNEMAAVLSQIVSRVEARIELDVSMFSQSSGTTFQECGKNLLDILCREISTRNEKAAKSRSRQLMNHVLLESEMRLQEIIIGCRRNRQRLNVGLVMKEISKVAVSKFRSSSSGFLSTEALLKYQADLLNRLSLMANHCSSL